MATAVHPFERAGLGRAPYRCFGCRENRFEMPGFGWKPGGTCDYCGTGILYEYRIKSADGIEFVVGCDCVEKTGGYVEGFREERTRIVRERRQKKASERRAVRQAEWEKIRAAEAAIRREEFQAEHSDLASQLASYAGENSFMLAMKETLAARGYLTANMVSVVARNLERITAEENLRASSRHYGVVGKRIKGVRARVVFVAVVGHGPVYPYPKKYLVKFITEDGSVLVWFTGTWCGVSEELETISFGVKDHGEYNQTKQTIVQRVTFKESK